MSKETSVLDLLSIARTRWVWVAGTLAVFLGLGYLYTALQEPTFEATARVSVSDNASERALDPGSQNTGFLERELANELALARSPEVEALVEAELGLLPDMSITPEIETDVLAFRSTADTAEASALAANTWSNFYVEAKQAETIEAIETSRANLEERLAEISTELDEIRAPLDSLRRRIELTTNANTRLRLQQDYELLADDLSYEIGLLNSRAQRTAESLAELDLQTELARNGEARVVGVAEVPDGPTNGGLARNLVVLGILGGLLGLGLAFLSDARDDRIRSAADVAAVTNYPVVATVPRLGKLAPEALARFVTVDPQGPSADEIHKLRTALSIATVGTAGSTILVTSPGEGEGRTSVAANLALAFSSVGHRTVLVDVDFRNGDVNELLGFPRVPGLTELTRREVEASRIAHNLPGHGAEDLLAIGSGTLPRSPAAFVANDAFIRTMRWIGTQAETIVLDGPSALNAAEARTLARHADLTVVVVSAGRTRRGELGEALAALRQVDAQVVGIVINGVKAGRQGARDRSAVDPGPMTIGLPESSSNSDVRPSGSLASENRAADVRAGYDSRSSSEVTAGAISSSDDEPSPSIVGEATVSRELAPLTSITASNGSNGNHGPGSRDDADSDPVGDLRPSPDRETPANNNAAINHIAGQPADNAASGIDDQSALVAPSRGNGNGLAPDWGARAKPTADNDRSDDVPGGHSDDASTNGGLVDGADQDDHTNGSDRGHDADEVESSDQAGDEHESDLIVDLDGIDPTSEPTSANGHRSGGTGQSTAIEQDGAPSLSGNGPKQDANGEAGRLGSTADDPFFVDGDNKTGDQNSSRPGIGAGTRSQSRGQEVDGPVVSIRPDAIIDNIDQLTDEFLHATSPTPRSSRAPANDRN